MTSMLETKGADYVAAWPDRIATQVDCPVETVLAAVETNAPGASIADLRPDQARLVVATAKYQWLITRIARGDLIEDVTKCRGCGLRLPEPYGDCRECC